MVENEGSSSGVAVREGVSFKSDGSGRFANRDRGVVSSDNSIAWLEVKGLPVETSSWGDASVVWLD